MDDTSRPLNQPEWSEALDESLAELAAGAPTVPADEIRRELLESIARMESKRAARRTRKTTARG
jgi:hypothetical protein